MRREPRVPRPINSPFRVRGAFSNKARSVRGCRSCDRGSRAQAADLTNREIARSVRSEHDLQIVANLNVPCDAVRRELQGASRSQARIQRGYTLRGRISKGEGERCDLRATRLRCKKLDRPRESADFYRPLLPLPSSHRMHHCRAAVFQTPFRLFKYT